MKINKLDTFAVAHVIGLPALLVLIAIIHGIACRLGYGWGGCN